MKKGYKGYKSYEYLEQELDYKSFKLSKEVGRVEPYLIPLTDEKEKRAEAIIDRNIVISLHDHPSIIPEDVNELMSYEIN